MFKAKDSLCIGSIACQFGHCLLPCIALPAIAAPDTFALGVKQFGAKTYPLAAANFKKAIVANPKNDSARYYYALSLHYNKDIPGAIKAYAELIRQMPDSNGASYARAALGKLDAALLSSLPASRMVQQQQYGQPLSKGSYTAQNLGMQQIVQSQSRHGGSTRNSADDKLPDDCRVYYSLENNSFVLDVYVNGRPMKMIFDTGAEICAFGKDNLVSAGIPVPTGQATGTSHGVGDGGAQQTWGLNVDLKVGTIERKNFHVRVQDSVHGYPLLGQTFFQDFTYTIDNGAKSIHFVRKRSNAGSVYAADPSRDPNSVPFTRHGNELVVNVSVNGRPTQLYFDTGATSVSLTKAQIKQLGLTIPEDADVLEVQGVAGTTRARRFNVRSMRMGPIEKRDFAVDVCDSEMGGLGLLGQTFYNDHQYTIDYERGYIHFLRR
jgi:clan AA aspartic protease (TIGR02281 family)